MIRGLSLALSAFIIAGGLLLLGVSQEAAAALWGDKAVLNQDDCMKCHAVIFEELREGKSKHKSKISCMDCHKGKHPSESSKGDFVPECTQCHKDTAHFALPDCAGCHHNPHQPLVIIFDEGIGQKPACNTCHPDKVTELNSHQTSHTGFACSFCHKEHRDRPDCLTCHKAHAQGQRFEDCLKCHQAHQPLTLTFGTDIANSECGACHSDIQETLEAGNAKHTQLQCVFCHANKHAVIPSCEQCHEKKHYKQMLQNFASCNDCHQSAHDILT